MAMKKSTVTNIRETSALKPPAGPSLSDLTSKVQKVVADAHTYLGRREGVTTDPLELADIKRWHSTLDKSAGKIVIKTTAESPPGHKASYGLLADQLDLTHRHVRKLHKYPDHGNVRFVLGTLKNQLLRVAEAGPNGPGHGPHKALE